MAGKVYNPTICYIKYTQLFVQKYFYSVVLCIYLLKAICYSVFYFKVNHFCFYKVICSYT